MSDAATSTKLPSPIVEDELTAFRNAFLTEIGDDLNQMVSLRELFDVVICAGKDISMGELKKLCAAFTNQGISEKNEYA